VLTQVPDHEVTLNLAAALAARLKRPADAFRFRQRLNAVNPWIWESHYALAQLFADRQEWANALGECEAVLRLHPASEEARTLLISCCLRSGKKERAEAEFQKLLALNPRDAMVLQSWFTEQKAAAP